MRHRWFLVLACGWALLQPPAKVPMFFQFKVWLDLETSTKGIVGHLTCFPPDYAAPLSQWDYIDPFESLKECEQVQSERLQDGRKEAKEVYDRLKNKKANLEELKDLMVANRTVLFFQSSRCVPVSLQLQ